MWGEELSDQDKEKSAQKCNSTKRKKYSTEERSNVLNHHVFESMANLIYFFEFVSLHHPELQEDYKDELEELLTGRNKNDKSKTPAFSRLVNGAISWDYKKDRF